MAYIQKIFGTVNKQLSLHLAAFWLFRWGGKGVRQSSEFCYVRTEDLPVLPPTKNRPFKNSIGNIPFHSSTNFASKW